MSNLIYIALTAINLVFPLIFFLIYIYLSMEVCLSHSRPPPLILHSSRGSLTPPPPPSPASAISPNSVTSSHFPLTLTVTHSGSLDLLSPDLGLLGSDHWSAPLSLLLPSCLIWCQVLNQLVVSYHDSPLGYSVQLVSPFISSSLPSPLPSPAP
jgi:hypothetical protein